MNNVIYMDSAGQVNINGKCYTKQGLEAKIPRSKIEEIALRTLKQLMSEKNVQVTLSFN